MGWAARVRGSYEERKAESLLRNTAGVKDIVKLLQREANTQGTISEREISNILEKMPMDIPELKIYKTDKAKKYAMLSAINLVTGRASVM